MATRPGPPSQVKFNNIEDTSLWAYFTEGLNGGAVIDGWQIGFATAGYGSPQHIWDVGSDKKERIYGLVPKGRYAFWARTHNFYGWSDWSVRSEVTTHGVPDAPDLVKLYFIKQTSVYAIVHPNGNGGSTVLETQIGYGLTDTAPQKTVVSDLSTTIAGLDPGRKHFFWARQRNIYGWSLWSPVSSATLIAGAYVFDQHWFSFVPKRAVPYVNVNGVWKVATPWARRAGEWRETAS